MLYNWRQRAESLAYRGHQNLLPDGVWGKLSHIVRNGTPMFHVGDSNRRMARVCRVLSGHAPYGAFRERFHLEGLTHCMFCGYDVPETRKHVLEDCRIWIKVWDPGGINPWDPSAKAEDLISNLDNFLRTNRAAFSFQLDKWHVLSEELLVNTDEELEAERKDSDADWSDVESQLDS